MQEEKTIRRPVNPGAICSTKTLNGRCRNELCHLLSGEAGGSKTALLNAVWAYCTGKTRESGNRQRRATLKQASAIIPAFSRFLNLLTSDVESKGKAGLIC